MQDGVYLERYFGPRNYGYHSCRNENYDIIDIIDFIVSNYISANGGRGWGHWNGDS